MRSIFDLISCSLISFVSANCALDKVAACDLKKLSSSVDEIIVVFLLS